MQTERILIFTKNWLGDVIFEEPFIRALKRKFPQSYIVCVTNYRCKDVVAAHPHVDEIIEFDDRRQDKGIIAKLKLIVLLRKKNITKAFILHRSFSRAVIIFFASIPERFGYATKKRGFLLTQPIQEPSGKIHRVDYFLHILKQTGLYIDALHANRYQFYIMHTDKEYIMSLLKSIAIEPHTFVSIHPGANWPPKRWPAKNFIDCINQINATYDVPIVITGGNDDIDIAQKIISAVTGRKPISLCGKTTIRQLGALLSLSRLVISADSGPLHIASGMGVPVIGLFGPTDPNITGPRGQDQCFIIKNVPSQCTLPCYEEHCPLNECMSDIGADRVLSIIKKHYLLETYEITEGNHS